MIYRNSAHAVALCEASDDHGGIAAHQELAKENSMIGMVVNAEITAPSIALFFRGSHEVGTFIELIVHHQSETENKAAKNRFWLLHGCIFRCAYGLVTSGEMVDPTSGIRTGKPENMTPNMDTAVKPHPAPLASTRDSPSVYVCEVDDGLCSVQNADLLKPTTGADTHDVHRLGLAGTRVAVFHISSYAWNHRYSDCCEKWLHFVAACVEHQADFIAGDSNQFAQQNFKCDDHSDYRSCIMIDLIERFLGHINMHSSALNRISYKVVSSTQADQYIRAMEGDLEADCDSHQPLLREADGHLRRPRPPGISFRGWRSRACF